MFGFARFTRHEGLVSKMAGLFGLDLAEEMQRGRLAPEELRSSVIRCLACTNADGCSQWQAAHADGADETPEYCRNSSLFSALKDEGVRD